MEQSIGPITPPLHSAGTDPAYIPGLTAPRPAAVPEPDPEQEVAERRPDDSDTHEAQREEPAERDPGAEEGSGGADGPGQEPGGPEPDGKESRGEESGAEESATEEGTGPAFEVSDRRAAIIADRTGITFRLDGEEAEFGWDEIGAVEVDTPRFGRRFAVTVYTGPRRWYEADVEAPARRLLKEWTADLDAVLDAYFEDDREDGERDDGRGDDQSADQDTSQDGAPSAGRKSDRKDETS
ncbi:hypothetical protein [Streptomyces sp. NPDC095613]|uniref:hypothetical protein n=1 Tax=Streptomyces sp. NPDC095613 TaxID=3155540 RepID=UPI00332455F7